MAFTVAAPPAITGHALRDSPWCGLTLKHMACTGDRSTTAKVIRSTDEQGRYGKRSRDRTQTNPDAKIFTYLCLSADHGAWIATINQQSRRKITGVEDRIQLVIWFRWGALYLGRNLQSARQCIFRSIFLQIFYSNSLKVLQQSCRSRIQLQFCHNSYCQMPTRSKLNLSPKMAWLHC
jgi:hypothetical protein